MIFGDYQICSYHGTSYTVLISLPPTPFKFITLYLYYKKYIKKRSKCLILCKSNYWILFYFEPIMVRSITVESKSIAGSMCWSVNCSLGNVYVLCPAWSIAFSLAFPNGSYSFQSNPSFLINSNVQTCNNGAWSNPHRAWPEIMRIWVWFSSLHQFHVPFHYSIFLSSSDCEPLL